MLAGPSCFCADGAYDVCTFWWLHGHSPPQDSKDQDFALIKHKPEAFQYQGARALTSWSNARQNMSVPAPGGAGSTGS